MAGLSITDDPRDIRDILPDALTDCGTAIPDSDSAAAQLASTHLARLHTDRQAAERWILDKVSEIITRSGYADSVLGLPLGGTMQAPSVSAGSAVPRGGLRRWHRDCRYGRRPRRRCQRT